MSSLEIVVNPAVVSKIQGYMNDPSYKEMIENAAQFNSKLGAERTMRLPFLDSQTGVAQNHSNLFMEPHQRLPGMKEGQIYTYPSKRWQKKRRQYLHNFMQPRFNLRKENNGDSVEVSGATLMAIENSPFVTPGPSNVSIPTSVPGPSSGGGSNPINIPEESKEIPKPDPEIAKQDWFYDELDAPDAGEFDEPDADSDYDYEESYSSKRKKKKTPAKTPRQQSKNRRKITFDPIGDSEKPFACDLCGARYKTRPGLTYHYTHSHKTPEDDEEEMDMDKRAGDEARRRSGGMPPPPVLHPQQPMPPTLQPQQPMPPSHHMGMGGPMPPPSMMHPHHHHPPPPHLVPQQPHQPHMPPHHQMYHHQPPGMPPPPGPPPGSYPQQQGQMASQQQLQQQQHPHPGHMPGGQGPGLRPSGHPMQHPGSNMRGNQPLSQEMNMNHPGPSNSNTGTVQVLPTDDPNFPRKMDDGKPRVPPSPYCDFCLGDAVENKKSGIPEELVSCSDCGRSGHPTCLQFTNNMIISVKKYRWQCIECKCCSLCGTSDNDDQLLFCDDCDRGYHMYCLIPKLDAPPEGSWSCTLCLAEFHKK